MFNFPVDVLTRICIISFAQGYTARQPEQRGSPCKRHALRRFVTDKYRDFTGAEHHQLKGSKRIYNAAGNQKLVE
ncbi:hypothetical protein Milano_049 [Agrobacterium phage Milano]|nr:hypothetical protein Milano_049 [Agrobacterium phage Milano]